MFFVLSSVMTGSYGRRQLKKGCRYICWFWSQFELLLYAFSFPNGKVREEGRRTWILKPQNCKCMLCSSVRCTTDLPTVRLGVSPFRNSHEGGSTLQHAFIPMAGRSSGNVCDLEWRWGSGRGGLFRKVTSLTKPLWWLNYSQLPYGMLAVAHANVCISKPVHCACCRN